MATPKKPMDIESGGSEKGAKGAAAPAGGGESGASFMIKWGSFVLNIAQASSYFLMMQYTQQREGFVGYSGTVAVLMQEALKAFLSFLVLAYTNGSASAAYAEIRSAYTDNWEATTYLLVPGVLYVVQNNMIYFATKVIGATSTQVILQLKMLTTAVFAMILLKRKFSAAQWGGLTILAAGCALVQLEAIRSSDATSLAPATEGEEESGGARMLMSSGEHAFMATSIVLAAAAGASAVAAPWVGVVASLLGATTSGAAGTTTELLLKNKGVGLWVKNFQLATWSIGISFILLLFSEDGRSRLSVGFGGEYGLFGGFDGLVWITVVLGSAGGLLIAILLRYLDAVIKNFATALAIIVSVAATTIIRGAPPSASFLIGIVLVAVAVVLYQFAPTVPTGSAAAAAPAPKATATAVHVTDEDAAFDDTDDRDRHAHHHDDEARPLL